MKGYTRKVGLRKSPLHFAALRVQKRVYRKYAQIDREPLPCPHCPCTQTTECCYCDGTRTPLEDS